MNRQRYYRSFWIVTKNNSVLSLVKEVRSLMPRIGTRKLYYLLKHHLRPMGVERDKLFAILRANQMLIKPKRNYRITTNLHHHFRKHKNLIANMDVVCPEQVWVADITYIGGRGNAYLSLITDAYSKRIMGYDLSDSLATISSLRVLKMANRNRKYKHRTLIHHSDRGLQYCSNDDQKMLEANKIIPSIADSYDLYANAVAERVNGILKQGFLLEDYKIDLKTLNMLVQEAVHIYNTKRPHWSCYMKTPEQMHTQNRIKVRTYKNNDSCQGT